ncbi:MAG: response regulator [Cyclobacteriaceae bacterium]|nr:response regulator [Cyclobacteriaceae bacterium]
MKIESILLVDDDEVTNFYNEYLINKMDICNTLHIAENGQIALDKITGQNGQEMIKRPIIIFLDINMPVMNGFEFLEAYTKLGDITKGDMVVCMLTTSLHEQDLKMANNFSEIAGYLNKPLGEKDITRIVDSYFEKNESNK